MGPNRTTAPEATAPQPAICRPRAHPGSRGPDGDPVRVADRPPVEHAATRDGLRIRHDLLAPTRALATRGRLEAATHGLAQRVAATGPDRFGPRRGGQFLAPRAARGEKTGPNPTDRRKAGSKHHVLTDAHGIPLVARLTAANRPDITQLLDLVDAMPSIGGRPRPPVGDPTQCKATAATTRSGTATNSASAASTR